MTAHRRGYTRRTSLAHESLETRSMLAGDCSAWQNPLDPNDLNSDGVVSPADALVAINQLNSGVSGDLSARLAPPTLHSLVQDAATDFVDASGDGYLSAADALAVINTINAKTLRGPLADVSSSDQQGDSPTDADPAIGSIDLSRGFTKQIAAINTAGDVDVFKLTPSKHNLHLTLFSANRVALKFSLATIDATVEGGVATLATATTAAGSRQPAKINFDVDTQSTYFVIVERAAPPAAEAEEAADEELAVYVLGALNYSDDQFRPVVDSELGDDQHGDTPNTATPLPLQNGVHALVRSNIDNAGDIDSFLVEVKDGKLIVEAGGRMDVELEIIRLDSETQLPIGSPATGTRHVVLSVTAGTYMVSVKAADDEEVGRYHLNVVNPPIRSGVPHDGPTGIGAIFDRLDKDNDDAVSKTELRALMPLDKIPVLDRIFNDWDTDDDGLLDFAEVEAKWESLHERAPLREPVREFFGRLRRR